MSNHYSQLSRIYVNSRMSDSSSSGDTSDDDSGGDDWPEDSPYNRTKVPMDNTNQELAAAEYLRSWINIISDKDNDIVKYLETSNIVTKPTVGTIDNGPDGFVVEVVSVGEEDNVKREVFYRGGVRHGYYREFHHKIGGFLALGRFENGHKSGIHWKRNLGKSFNVGQLTDRNESAGTENVLLYPDLITVIRGSYEGGRMERGRQGRLTGYTKEFGIPLPAVDGMTGDVFSYSPSSMTSISTRPMLRDPYETRYVYVAASGIPLSGEGLYAKETIRPGALCACFNGVRRKLGTENLSEYRILHNNIDLDIDPGDEALSRYCATLGHKVCHSFRPNAQFEPMEHPVYGAIMSIVASKEIREGEEILVSYNYPIQNAPMWYQELYFTHCRNHMNWTEKEVNNARDDVYGRKTRVPRRFVTKKRTERKIQF